MCAERIGVRSDTGSGGLISFVPDFLGLVFVLRNFGPSRFILSAFPESVAFVILKITHIFAIISKNDEKKALQWQNEETN